MYRVFSRLQYVALALSSAAATFLAIVWTPLVPLAWDIVSDSSLPLGTTLSFAGEMFYAALFEIGTVDLLYALAISALIGINISLLVFSFRMYRSVSAGAVASSSAGGIAAFFGFGCAACGSGFILSLLGASGAGTAALVAYETELSFLGFGLMLFATAMLARTINKPAVCPI